MDAKTEARTMSFMVFSGVLHTALAIALITMSVELKKTESVEIEILPTAGEQAITPIVMEEKQEQVQAPKLAEEESPALAPEPIKAEPVVAVAPMATKTAPAPKVAKAEIPKALPAARKAPVQASATETPVQNESPVVLPVVQNEELEQAPEEQVELKDEDVTSDFEKIDQEHKDKVAAAQAEMNEKAEKEKAEQNAKLLALQKKNEEESAQLAQANAEKRAQERAALAAVAAEKARQAEEARAAQAAAQAAAAEQEAQAKKQGELASTQKESFGGGGEVRSVEDLKQMPGNEKPMYEAEDRLKGRKGEVSFMAYVTKEGFLSNFKMLKSSGHRELDAKTLKAIKGWKFYPGQEGMVEIPFSWDLKGGVKPVGPILRTKRSASTSAADPYKNN